MQKHMKILLSQMIRKVEDAIMERDWERAFSLIYDIEKIVENEPVE